MADDILVNTTGLAANTTYAADEISSVKYPRSKLIHGADGTNNGDVSSANPLPVTACPRIPATGSFSRPADTTTYAFGDIVANSTTAGSVTPITISAARITDQNGQIIGGTLRKSGTSPTLAIFRVHLFNANPTIASGDNAAFSTTIANWLGAMDVTCSQVGTDGCIGTITPVLSSTVPFKPATGTQNIFALIEARGAYVPVSGETFTLELDVD
jgi:hypothetical protein